MCFGANENEINVTASNAEISVTNFIRHSLLRSQTASTLQLSKREEQLRSSLDCFALAGSHSLRSSLDCFALAGSHLLRSWSIPGRFEHLLHDSDLDRLVREYVRGKLVNRIVLGGAVGLEEIVHHIDRALMVFDHPDEEQAIELCASRLLQFGHFLVSQHSRH